jgi:hypothetical protein
MDKIGKINRKPLPLSLGPIPLRAAQPSLLSPPLLSRRGPARRPPAQPPLFFPWPPFHFPFFPPIFPAQAHLFPPRAAQLGSSRAPTLPPSWVGRPPHPSAPFSFLEQPSSSFPARQPGVLARACAQRTAARRGAMAQPPCNPAAVSPTSAHVSRAHIERITHDALVQETGLLTLPCSTQSLSLARHRTGRKPNHRL